MAATSPRWLGAASPGAAIAKAQRTSARVIAHRGALMAFDQFHDVR